MRGGDGDSELLLDTKKVEEPLNQDGRSTLDSKFHMPFP